jgi:hypothetical protein
MNAFMHIKNRPIPPNGGRRITFHIRLSYKRISILYQLMAVGLLYIEQRVRADE